MATAPTVPLAHDLVIQRVQFPGGKLADARTETLTVEALAKPKAATETVDDLLLVLVAPGGQKRWQSELQGKFFPAGSTPIVLRKGPQRVEWTPGRAVIFAEAGNRDELRSAVLEFAYYEGQLRALETELERHVVSARQDVALAHRIRKADSAEWPRLGELAEHFTRLRLDFGHLEPALLAAPPTLSDRGAALYEKMAEKSLAEDRLEAATNRLENYEDLYEGANDRVSDYRWYRAGFILEVIIIVLLLLEVIIMGGELGLRLYDYLLPE